MTSRLRIPFLVLVLLTAQGCDRLPFQPWDRDVTLRIAGSWESSESPPSATPPAGCLLHIETAQTGHGSVIGAFHGSGETCITAAHPSDTAPIWDHDPAPPYLVAKFDSRMTWMTDAGDELWLEATAADFVQSQANGASTVSGVLTIGGGTGRYSGASGEMVVSGGRGPGEPGDVLAFEGEIVLQIGGH